MTLRISVEKTDYAQSLSPTLHDPRDWTTPGSSVHGTLQASRLKWVTIFSSRGPSQPRNQTSISCIGRQILYHWATWEACFTAVKVKVLFVQLYPSLCDPMDCSPSGPSVHGILQARIPEWVAMPFPRVFFPPRDQTQVSCIAGRVFTFWDTWEAQM